MKREEKLERTHKAILKTSTKLFLNRGYAQTSTRDIAKQIGITQPALYHHFKDKEVLYLDVMNEQGTRVRQEIQRVLRNKNLDIQQQLQEITNVYLKLHPQSVYSFYQEARRQLSLSARRKLDTIFTMDYINPLAQYFGQDVVNLRPDVRPREAAELYLAELQPLHGTVLSLGGHAVSPEQRQRVLLDCILNGFIAR